MNYERQAFEAWCAQQYPNTNMARCSDGYAHTAAHRVLPITYANVQMLWEAWQAARAASPAQQPVPSDEEIEAWADSIIRTRPRASRDDADVPRPSRGRGNQSEDWMMDKYVLLPDGSVKPASLMDWAAMYQSPASRRVGDDTINGVRVSTVFLGLDHSYGDGPPLLFETKAFGGDLDEACERCSTLEEAKAQHEAMCERVRAT
jgi:hypothetical protein